MARKSNAVVAMQAAAVNADEQVNLTAAMQRVVNEIDNLFSDAQAASITALWQIGKLIHDVGEDPNTYLTAEQLAAQIEPSALLISLFSKIYTSDQMRSAETFFEKYPTNRHLQRLLDLRSADSPRWRITASHVQLLTQISDDEQRQALEDKCAEEALPAKTLAVELQEVRGKKPGGGRKHKPPTGLKNQLHDFLQHIRRFIGRSESLWLGDENLYDDFMNTAPAKREGVAQAHWEEIQEQLYKLHETIEQHIAMYKKAVEALGGDDDEEEEVEEEEADSEVATAARRAAAAAAASRRKSNITR
jgi:hypothetical protein